MKKKLSARNWIGSGGALPASMTPRRTTIDCVATDAVSHAPLMPWASVGFLALTVTAVKKVYITTPQSSSPVHQRTRAICWAPSTTMFCVPSTQAPATQVKNPGALW